MYFLRNALAPVPEGMQPLVAATISTVFAEWFGNDLAQLEVLPAAAVGTDPGHGHHGGIDGGQAHQQAHGGAPRSTGGSLRGILPHLYQPVNNHGQGRLLTRDRA